MDKTLAGSDSECLLVSVGACMSDLGRGACMGRPWPRTCLRQTWWDLRRSISVFLTSCIVGEDRQFPAIAYCVAQQFPNKAVYAVFFAFRSSRCQ